MSSDEQLAQTTQNFYTTLMVSGGAAVGIGIVSILLRPHFKHIYDNRRFSFPDKNLPVIGNGYFGWILKHLRITEADVEEHVNHDAAIYLTILKTYLLYCLACSPVAYFVLLPVYATGNMNNTGLDLLNLANLSEGNNPRYVATVLSMYYFTILAWVCMAYLYKTFYAVRLRFFSKGKPYNFSVFVRGIPKEIATKEGLYNMFDKMYPNQVKETTICRDVSELDKLVNKRTQFIYKYESSLHKFVVTKPDKKTGVIERPTHKAKICCGDKRDSIEYYQGKIEKYNELIKVNKSTPAEINATSGFVTFKNIKTAAYASQCLHHKYSNVNQVSPSCSPSEIFWMNVPITPNVLSLRKFLMTLFTWALVLLWMIPITFAQSLVSLPNLDKLFPGIQAFLEGNSFLNGLVSGVLPTLVVTIFMALLPMICRWIAILEGEWSESRIMLKVFNKLYYFEFVNVFLVSTLSGGVISSIGQIIDNPSYALTLLGTSIPQVSTFFICYIITLATLVAILRFSQLIRLIIVGLKLKYLAKTKRAKADVNTPPMFNFAAVMGDVDIVICLTFTYLPIAPLLLVFSTLFFAVMYFCGKFDLMFVYEPMYDTGGYFYKSMFGHSCFSLFIANIVLIALFGIKKTYWAFALIPLPVLTLLFWIYIQNFYERSVKYLNIWTATKIDTHQEQVLARLSGEELPQIQDFNDVDKALSSSESSTVEHVQVQQDKDTMLPKKEQPQHEQQNENVVEGGKSTDEIAEQEEELIEFAKYVPKCVSAPLVDYPDQDLVEEYSRINKGQPEGEGGNEELLKEPSTNNDGVLENIEQTSTAASAIMQEDGEEEEEEKTLKQVVSSSSSNSNNKDVADVTANAEEGGLEQSENIEKLDDVAAKGEGN